jgi:hypothetical protein
MSGHYFSELFPDEAAESSDFVSRFLELRKKLENIPLSRFTVGDFDALYRVMHQTDIQDVQEEDLVHLELKIKK